MITPKICKKYYQFVFLLPVILLSFLQASAQQGTDTIKVKSLYRPPVAQNRDTITVSDSMLLRQQFVEDSIQARMAFIRDSIAAREQFVRDSIARRERILDSLNILKAQLPGLLEAALKTLKDDIIIGNRKITIVGDSTLSDYFYRILPFSLSQPYTPWKASINLSDNPIKMGFEPNSLKINSIQAPSLKCTFIYGRQKNILRIIEQGIVLNKSTGKLYKEPIDSVFFDAMGRVAKVKRYINFHQVVNNYQMGAPLFLHLTQVKQYEYNAGSLLSKYQEVNFCDRWSKGDQIKVCNIITYTVNLQGNNYLISRQNDPPNNYSDGTYTLEYDQNNNLKSLAFKNNGGSENWKTFIEVNAEGNVTRYLFQINDKVHQSMDFNYHLNDPQAKYKVEIIKNSFEDDGICYLQTNTTTGKSRTRDRMTGEWGPWK